jgi:hypothetical protein
MIGRGSRKFKDTFSVIDLGNNAFGLWSEPVNWQHILNLRVLLREFTMIQR